METRKIDAKYFEGADEKKLDEIAELASLIAQKCKDEAFERLWLYIKDKSGKLPEKELFKQAFFAGAMQALIDTMRILYEKDRFGIKNEMPKVHVRLNDKDLGEAIYCNTIMAGSLGLMFSSEKMAVFPVPEEMRDKVAIHMIFVRFRLDVAWLDKDKVVIDITRNAMPFQPMYKPENQAPVYYFVELPANKYEINIGDKFEFE